jgi:hypothetical protein
MSREFRKLFNRCALRQPPYWISSNHYYTKFTPFHRNGVADVGVFFKDQRAKLLLVSGGDVRIYSCKNGNLLFNFSMRDNATFDELRLRIYDLKLDYRYPQEAKFKLYKCTFSPEKNNRMPKRKLKTFSSFFNNSST